MQKGLVQWETTRTLTGPIGLRWTVGNVSPEGFQALRLSILGAWKIFGPDAAYAVCVNSIPLEVARQRAGPVPEQIEWVQAHRGLLPDFLQSHLDEEMSEGVGWKFAPLRLFPERYELALDNDCILWDLPAGLRNALAAPQDCLLAEDVRPCFGQFAALCGPAPRNSGIRGVPPRFDLERAMHRILGDTFGLLKSELDEQGLQVAALTAASHSQVVRVHEVTICSPFPPHLPRPGSCGAHFVGLNARSLPWDYYGRPASDCVRENWEHWRSFLEAQVQGPLTCDNSIGATAQASRPM